MKHHHHHLLLLLLSLLLFIVTTIDGAEPPESHLVESRCGTTYVENSSLAVINFAVNMEKIANKIVTAGFAISHTGTGHDQSYAFSQCYDYLSPLQCRLCFSELRSIGPLCFPINTGTIFLDGCVLSVSDYKFYQEYSSPHDRAWCGNATRRGGDFGSAVRMAVGRAVTRALGNAGQGSGKAVGRGGVAAYAMVSCWRMLNSKGCRACLANASATAVAKCVPYSEGRVANAGCFLRYSDVDFLGGGGGSKVNKKLKIFVIVCSLGIAILAFAFCAFIHRRNRMRRKRRGLNDPSKMAYVLRDKSLNFKYSTLEKATGSFNPDNKLGEGGYGTVYKGAFSDGREIAVKRLFFHNRHRAMDFFNEVNIISSVEHKNLVRLLGCCCSGPESLLVYEYLPNKSLDLYIFDSEKGKELNWERRFKIITGTAQGLLHLHENPTVRIIHRDIKVSNILLDSKLQAKIADFGLARSFEGDESHISTAIAGTLGYMAPEYVAHGQLTERVDVYSFGVLVLEIITGRKNGTSKTSEYTESLLTISWKHYQSGSMEELIDPNITHGNNNNIGLFLRSQILRTAQIAFLCTQENPSLRPTMSRALQMLLRRDEDLPVPTNPPFTDEDTMQIHTDSHCILDRSSSSSVATMSHSSFWPR